MTNELLTSLVQVAGYAWANSTLSNKVNWLLNGFPGLDYESTAIIFKTVQSFLMQTERFCSSSSPLPGCWIILYY